MVNTTLVARPVRQISHVHMRGKMTARHIESKTRKEFSALKNLTDLCRVFLPNRRQTDNQRAVTRAEVLMCELVAKLNLPITAADTFNKAFKIMFPRFKNSTRYTLFLFEKCLCISMI